MNLSNETLLHGEKYKILSKISQGNFGITYLAEQTSLDRKVCIKEFFFRGSCERSVNGQVTVTTSGQDVTNSFRRKFIREAKRLSQFDHPNIVKVIDVFEENGTAYMVMDYVEGETLQQLVDRKGKLSEKEALEYIIPLCHALEVVHEKNLLHLDIKPSNILIKSQTNTPVLIDFGISKFTEASGEDHSTTTPVALTKGYAPLEQYGQDLAKLNTSTDVYSVAATLYKLVTGVTPPEAAVIVQDGLKPPKEINSALSGQLNAIILQSLSVKPSHRALSISKLKADLKGISKEAVVPETDGDTEVLGEIKNQESHVYKTKTTDEQPIHYEPVRESKNPIILWLAAIAVIVIVIAIVMTNNNPAPNSSNEVRKTEVISENNLPITPQAIQYSKYYNSRYNYSIDYPKDILFEQPESGNGDGTIFKTRDGNEKLRAYGTSNMDLLTATEITIEQKFDEELYGFSQDKSTITYKKIGKSFFVISGYNSGNIFYIKAIKCKDNMGSDAFAYALLTYNDAEKDVYDKVAANIMKTFK